MKQPQDTNYDTYTNPWITRYLYDLTGSPTLSFNGGVDYSAYGNLYKTQGLLPPGSGLVTQNSTSPLSVANTVYQDLKGTAFDGLDRPIHNFAMIDSNGGTADSVSTETITYDSTNEYGTFPGHVVSDCNAVSQCKYPGYDSINRQNAIGFSDSLSPARTTSFDPDGHIAGVTSAAYGTQSYTYDANGNKLTEQEASGGTVTSPATFSHVYYADGKLAQVNVTSSGLSQTALFAYSYRVDGLVQTQTINVAAQSNVGSTSVGFTYYPSGRPEQRTESGPAANPNPTSWQYDGYGHLAQTNYPACTSCNSENLRSPIHSTMRRIRFSKRESCLREIVTTPGTHIPLVANSLRQAQTQRSRKPYLQTASRHRTTRRRMQIQLEIPCRIHGTRAAAQ